MFNHDDEIDKKMNISKESVKIISNKILTCNALVVITGAGISAESGIPTFRGEGGYWKTYKAEELATPEAFQKNPKLVWEWYDYRRNICQNATPNLGHTSLAQIESMASNFHLITQNVDNLHRRAGNKNISEIHGNIFWARCLNCKNVLPLDDRTKTQQGLKFCQICQGPLRPHIVWFGESYDTGLIHLCFESVKKADILLVIGTSGAVTMPEALALEAKKNKALLIEINPEVTTLTNLMDFSLQGRAGEVLPKLVPTQNKSTNQN